MKTFDEILQQHYIHDKGLNNPAYIKNAAFEFALQVAEAVKDEILYCVNSGMSRQEIIDEFHNSTFEKFIK